MPRIIEVLWESRTPAAARNQVHVLVSGLRTALTLGPGLPSALGTLPDGYVLRSPPARTDLQRLAARIADAGRATAAGRLPETRALLQEALGRWRGTPLNGLDGRFAASESARLQERWLSVREQRIDLDLMYCCERSGDALASYREGRRVLVAELGIESAIPQAGPAA